MGWKEKIVYPIAGPVLKTGLRLLSRTRLPQTSGKFVISAATGAAGTWPAAPVEVLRDRWGVAHIYAGSAADALFGQGFVHAQERLWQMDFNRRVVAGRLSEILGKVALPYDRAMRTLGLRRVAEQEARLVSGKFCTLLEAYCAGANAWIENASAHGKLPVEFTLLGYTPEPWQPADAYGWGKLMCWDLAANWQTELMRAQIVQRLGEEKTAALTSGIEQAWAVILDAGQALAGDATLNATRPFAGPQAGEGVGSNNWVVHGSRTASGKPLLANDMHLGLTAPAIWYENHLAGGELEVSGVSFPGVPLVVAGHNRQVAWGFTDGFPDVQDLYEEHLRRNSQGLWEAEFRGEWQAVEVRREEIRVKGVESFIEEVKVTRHGPLINCLFDEAYPDMPPLALRWTSLEPETLLEAFYAMNIAASCSEFHQALRGFSSPVQNTVYADTQGNIAYSLPGSIPIRARGDGTLPVPGWSGEYEWTGLIPFEQLPYLDNPPRGFVATANNPVNREDFPHLISKDFGLCDRAARISELLQANPAVDIPFIKKMHFDQVSWSARALAAHLGRLETDDPALREIIAELRAWDGQLAASSPLAAIYEATIRRAVRLLLDHLLGDLGVRAQGQGPWAGLWTDHTWEWFINLLETPTSPWFDLGGGERRDDVLLKALKLAVDQLTATLGPDRSRWTWGKLHTLTFGHVLGALKPLDAAFSLGPLPVGGDGSTIWATLAHMHDLEGQSVVGPPFRFIADLGDLEHCWGLLAPGQSGHPGSPHYNDGVQAWFEAGYHPMLFRRDEVEANLEARLMLEREERFHVIRKK